MSEIASDTHAKQSSLKKLTSGSSWISPFRSGSDKEKKTSALKQYKESNKLEHIKVPSKFTVHPTLEAEKKRLAEEKKAEEEKEVEEKVAADGEAEADEEEKEPVEEIELEAETEAGLPEVEPETEVAEAEVEAVEPNDAAESPEVEAEIEAAEVEVDEKTEEPAIEAKKVFEPVDDKNKEVIEQLKDKPLLLNRYEALNATAIGSVSRRIDDPNKVVNLGSGLKMSQEQLLAIAAARVAPVLANIDDEVKKTRSEDEIKRQQEISGKVKSHESKLLAEYDKHVRKIGKKKEKFDKDIDDKITDIIRLQRNAEKNAIDFKTQTEGEIETANTEYADREAKAIEKHGTDHETLLKNHEELEATKKQELEDAKLNQEKTTTEIEELQEKKSGLDNKNSELSTQIEELTTAYNAEIARLDELKAKFTEKSDAVSKNLATKDVLDSNIAKSKEAVANKKESHTKLTAEVGLLAGALAAYGAKLASLKSDREVRNSRLSDAKKTFEDWTVEKKDIAAQVARDHEKQRIEAQEAAETKRVQDELERQRVKEEREIKEKEEAEERERQEKKEAEERERQEKKNAEEKERLEKEQAEWEEKEGLLKRQAEREEAERLKDDPEFQRQQRLKQREEEEQQLLAEREEQERKYKERKSREDAEYVQLLAEIDELKAKKQAQIDAEKLEAERTAQAKLDEIERLKDEHDARMNLYKKKLELEELQKERLLEEVDNLRKIKNLREEKSRLASEVAKPTELHDIQHLIEERELEVARLTKQIELDDDELYRSIKKDEPKSFLGVSNDLPDSGKRAIPEVRVEPEVEAKGPISKSAVVGGVAGVAGVVAAGAGVLGNGAVDTSKAVGNGAVDASKTAYSKLGDGSKESKIERTGSLSNKIKHFGRRLSGFGGEKEVKEPKKEVKPDAKKVSKKERVGVAAVPGETPEPAADPFADSAVAEDPSKHSHKVKDITDQERKQSVTKTDAAVVETESEYDTYSIYEEVDDEEFEANKGNPDYFEVNSAEYAKHVKA